MTFTTGEREVNGGQDSNVKIDGHGSLGTHHPSGDVETQRRRARTLLAADC